MTETESLIQLKQALDRLLAGNPIRTKNDGKINLIRICQEADVILSALYFYDDFVANANKKIKEHNEAQARMF